MRIFSVLAGVAVAGLVLALALPSVRVEAGTIASSAAGPPGAVGATGDTGASGAAGTFNGFRKIGWWAWTITTDTTFTAGFMPAASASCAGGASADVSGNAPASAAFMVKCLGTNVSNQANGWTAAFTATRWAFVPTMYAVIGTDASATAQRTWVGMTTATLSASDDPTAEYCAARHSSAVGANWFACSRGAGAQGCRNTTVAYATSTTYNITADMSTGACIVTINGTAVEVSAGTDPSGVTNGVAPNVTVTNIADDTQTNSIWMGHLTLDQN